MFKLAYQTWFPINAEALMISGCGQWSRTELWMCPLVKIASTPGKAVVAFAKMNAAAAANPTCCPSDAPDGDVESISIQLEAGLALGLLLTNRMQWKWHVWLLRCISAFVMEFRLRTTAKDIWSLLLEAEGPWEGECGIMANGLHQLPDIRAGAMDRPLPPSS